MKIRSKIILSLLIISIGGISLLSYFTYQFAKKQIIFVRAEQLQALTYERKRNLTDILKSWKDRGQLIASRTQLRTSLKKQLTSPSQTNIDTMKQILNDALNSVSDIEAIVICGPTGKLIVKTDTPSETKYTCDDFPDTTSTDFQLHDVWMKDPKIPQMQALLTGPITFENTRLATLKTYINAQELLSIVHNYSGLGSTGETLFARRKPNGDAEFLTPLRYHPNETLSFSVNKNRMDVPITHALLKKEIFMGEKNIVDYRNIPVLAATNYVPELDWGIVAKLDRSDALTPVAVLLRTIIIFTLVLSSIVIIIGIFFSKAITTPITELVTVAKKIKDGDLSQRASITNKDETGLLAETLNATLSSLEKTLKQREKLIDQLKTSNKELDNFAYVAAHDLKAPLRVIDNASKWLEEDLEQHLTPDTRETLELLQSRSKRMEKLLDDLLEYSRIGKLSTDRFHEKISVKTLLHDITELLSPPKHITIKQGPNLDQISVNRMPLQQILLNLISNAIKHHNKKTGTIEITVTSSDSNYHFTIKDDGPGIPKKFHKDIFKMFKTLKPRDEVEGSGMGLAIVDKYIKLFGGKIEISSIEGEETTITFSWPKNQHNT